MHSLKAAIGYGILTWLTPFIVSFGFYTPEGEIRGDIFQFKSVMIVVAALTSSYLLMRYFRSLTTNYISEGVRVGMLWLSINLVLDALILLSISDLTTTEYINQIGIRYLIIPITGIAFGYVAHNASKSAQR